jgi:hypothetical protein
MSLTRGGNVGFAGSYTDTLWKVESLTLLPLTGMVEVTAIWSSDLLTELAYLLDDETQQLVTSQATHGGNPTVTNGSVTITFTGGSLITTDVRAGDILVLQDATEGATGFLRNRGIRIFKRNSATSLDVDAAESTAFGGAGITVATWKILRGKTNLALGGIGSYVDGTTMYGANANLGLRFDGAPANRFKSG